MTATQPYRGRHSAPDDESRDETTADPAQTTLAAPDNAPAESDAPAESEVAPAARKRKFFALRGDKAR